MVLDRGWRGEMGQLSGKQTSRLSDALRDAFTPDGLDQLLFYTLNIRPRTLPLTTTTVPGCSVSSAGRCRGLGLRPGSGGP